MQLFLPKPVFSCISVLRDAGYEAFCVGGAVRDLIMGRRYPSDFDIASSCPPEITVKLFPENIPTGIKHGTVTVICEGMPLEVTTYRTESGYSDTRHPDSVQYVNSIKEDLSRRDFTVNAIAYNDEYGIYDPYCGANDIESKILRTVGDPNRRFGEDALRIMRLYRFASQLGFMPEKNTEEAARKNLGLLREISSERILSELLKLLCGESIQLVDPLFKAGGLGFAGINACDPSPLTALPCEADTRLAALLYLSKSNPDSVLKYLKADNRLSKNVKLIDLLLKSPIPISDFECKNMMCRTGAKCFIKSLKIRVALGNGQVTDLISRTEKMLKKHEPYRISELDINGNDLRNIGLCGKEIGLALETLLQAVQHDPSINRKEKLTALITKQKERS